MQCPVLLTPALFLLVLTLQTAPAFAQPPQSNHGDLRVVPAPGPVVIDGKLDEWDTSGEMFVYGVRKIRERYSVRVHAMWDAQAFYLGMRFRDPSPLINKVDADGAPGDGWLGLSLRSRSRLLSQRLGVSADEVHRRRCSDLRRDEGRAIAR